MEELQQALLRRQQLQDQQKNLSGFQQQGDIGGIVASIGQRRVRGRLAQEDAKITQLSEQRRQALISTLDPQQQEQAQQLESSTLEKAVAERLTPSETRKTLKDATGRQRFVDTGEAVFEDVDQQETTVRIPEELQTGQNFGERAVEIEQIANQNAAIGNNQLARQQFSLAGKLRKQENIIEKDVNDLSKRLEKSDVGGLINSMERLAGFASEAEDVPGVGKTSVVPNILLSPKGREVRQSVLTFANQLVKAQSGLQINESEAGRIFKEMGLEPSLATGGFKVIPGTTDDQLRTGLRNAISRIKAKVKTVKSGHRGESVKRFNERVGGDYETALDAINVKDFRQPQTEQPAQQEVQEGTVIENEATGEELIFRGGQWQKV